MSIYDRDYYHERSAGSRSTGWGNNYMRSQKGMTPVVQYLLLINIAVFLVQIIGARMGIPLFQNPVLGYHGRYPILGPSPFTQIFGLYGPYLLGRFMFWQFITYQFVHAGFWHLFLNMFVLFMIGRMVERQIGSSAFIKLYLLGGIFAGIINLVPHIFIDVPTVGASGAICAILATFGLMNPHTRMVIFIFFFPIIAKARTIVIGYAIMTVIFALGARDGIAHLAHLGGLIFGWMYVYNIIGVRLLIDGTSIPHSGQKNMSWQNIRRKTRRFFGPKPRVYKGQSYEDAEYYDMSSPHNTQWDSRIDDILDKMKKHGIHSLTQEEWDILDRSRKK